MRPIARIERHIKNVWCATGEFFRRLREAPAAQVSRELVAGDYRKGARKCERETPAWSAIASSESSLSRKRVSTNQTVFSTADMGTPNMNPHFMPSLELRLDLR